MAIVCAGEIFMLRVSVRGLCMVNRLGAVPAASFSDVADFTP